MHVSFPVYLCCLLISGADGGNRGVLFGHVQCRRRLEVDAMASCIDTNCFHVVISTL